MAHIHGQIDSLKQIRSTLDLNGISRFNSINELNDFLKNYKSEEKLIQQRFENEIAEDIIDLKQRIHYNQEVLKSLRNKSLREHNRKIIANFNRKVSIKNPRVGSVAKACTETRIPDLTRNVPSKLNENAAIASNNVQLLNRPRFSVTARE